MEGREAPDVSVFAPQIADALRQRAATMTEALTSLAANSDPIAQAAAQILAALTSGHRILVAGNGGSAAEAQHFAAELVGRYRRERSPYPAVALTADSSTVTAIANDYGYENVFARQVAGLGSTGDIFVAYSTSGESQNLVRAAEEARRLGMTVIAIVGSRPSTLSRAADLALHAPVAETPVVQEIHLLFTHLICDMVEPQLAQERPSSA